MNAQDIRNTITMLERTSMEFVANRDFKLAAKTVKDDVTYALGRDDHDYDDNRKADYSIYKLVRTGGFEYNDKFYPQEFYTEVENLKLSPYAKPQEAVEAFKDWVATH